MEELKNSPVENFDWDAYEKGEVYGDKSREELVNTYDQSLNTVKDKEVIEQKRSRCKYRLQIGWCHFDERIPLQS